MNKVNDFSQNPRNLKKETQNNSTRKLTMSDEKKRILDFKHTPINVPDVFTTLDRIETGLIKEPPSQVILPPPCPDDEESSCGAQNYLVFIYLFVFILIIILSSTRKDSYHHHHSHQPKIWGNKEGISFAYLSRMLFCVLGWEWEVVNAIGLDFEWKLSRTQPVKLMQSPHHSGRGQTW